ncbi:MAG: TldD/PmbA family protein [Chloroflexota bacterium]
MTAGGDALNLCADVVARARAAGADEAEAYFEDSTTRTIDARAGALESVTTASARGIGVRVLVGGALGYASGTDLDAAARADLAEQAVHLARACAPDPARVLPDPALATTADLAIFDPSLPDLPLDAILELLTRAERAALATDARIDTPHIERYGQVVERVAVANSRGVSVSTASTLCYLSLSMIARQDGDVERGYANMVARSVGQLDPEAIGYRAARRAVTPIGGSPLSTRRASVIFEPDVIAEMLRTLAEALAGDVIFRGRSLFAPRTDGADWIGRKIGSDAVTLIDDGALPAAPGTLPFDGEGIPTQATTLIEGGILRGVLHNCESAARAGARSTANGARANFRMAPEVGQTNLVLQPGTRAPAALVASVDDGLYVVATRNVGGISPVSGDYSVGASGRRIVNGELAEPVSGVTLAAPMLELLANVREVGSDLRWVGGSTGYVGCPTVLVDDVTIGGR